MFFKICAHLCSKRRIGIPQKLSEAKAKALRLAGYVFDKKAKDVTILDVKKNSSICDYFVICSGESGRQVRAIYEDVVKACKQDNIEIHHYENDESSRWILIDFFDVILHIFQDGIRQFYNLEHLWYTAKKVRLPAKLARSQLSR